MRGGGGDFLCPPSASCRQLILITHDAPVQCGRCYKVNRPSSPRSPPFPKHWVQKPSSSGPLEKTLKKQIGIWPAWRTAIVLFGNARRPWGGGAQAYANHMQSYGNLERSSPSPPGTLTSGSLRELKAPADKTLLFVHFPDGLAKRGFCQTLSLTTMDSSFTFPHRTG